MKCKELNMCGYLISWPDGPEAAQRILWCLRLSSRPKLICLLSFLIEENSMTRLPQGRPPRDPIPTQKHPGTALLSVVLSLSYTDIDETLEM